MAHFVHKATQWVLFIIIICEDYQKLNILKAFKKNICQNCNNYQGEYKKKIRIKYKMNESAYSYASEKRKDFNLVLKTTFIVGASHYYCWTLSPLVPSTTSFTMYSLNSGFDYVT